MACFSFIFRRSRTSRGLSQTSRGLTVQSKEEIPGSENVTIFSYKELRIATEDFSPGNKVGEGGFGSVYRGTLKDGTVVAVKVLSNESKQGVREFLTELSVISSIVHENLVRLIGCCLEGNHRILVYNYLENNSIAQSLLGGRRSSIQFSWRTRFRICVGIARGLAFLHEEVRPHIVHRDIKAGNILLDKDLTPKISDFGLARLLLPNMTHVSTRVAGTIGYLAPEYGIRGQVTKKSDVYSFGVLLLEIVTGRCNMDTKLPYEEQFLVERVWALNKRKELSNILDTSLCDDLNVDEACRFLKVGLMCTQEAFKARPSMSSVLKMLTGDMDVDLDENSKPGLITDYMDLKVRRQGKANKVLVSSMSSGTETPSSEDNTHPSMTFTAISERE